MSVGCHVPRHTGKSTRLHTPLCPPRRSQPLAHPVDTAGRPLGPAGLEFGTATVPTMCCQCKTAYFSVF